ncbi:hypothetical protein DCS_07855 [Drechmeria coniospora]|uniref:Plasma membrane fusion protein PRM1 n=1 Tax=Drechmeria coniospora TaxID=98403 RepID=A0A151GFL1_DRECN|nr:hypothetical protein DCS_07855 [Drechmeria coniospora]KYK55890.1 hypothetical protein DCS_07855 [Drechmeria coniospora]
MPCPDVPASLEPDSSGMCEKPVAHQARIDTAPSVTPYLNLPSRLSQVWINRWTVLLLLVLVRVLLLIGQLDDNVDDARAKALSACTKVEDIGSSMASMPHYLSRGVNELAAAGIEQAVHAMVKGLDLVMQGVQGIILFYINFLTATYVCLITAIVHGSLEAVASVTEDAAKALNKVIDGAAGEIKDISSGLETAVKKIAGGIQKSIIGQFTPELPKIDFSKPLDTLRSFHLNADDFAKDVRQLSKDLPDFDGVQNLTKQAIAIPFDIARSALGQSMGTYKFDRDAFPLAQKRKLTFCSDNDRLNGFFLSLSRLLHKARIAFAVPLCTFAFAAMIPMAWFEVRRWRRQQQHAKLISQGQYDPMDVVYIVSRPTTATCGIKISSRLGERRRVLSRWCVAYATSTPAIFVLSLAMAGFFSCLCQVILLKAVQKEVPALASQIGGFADEVIASLDKVSSEWAAGANGVVKRVNDDVNNEVLAYVTNATDAVNRTLNVFLDGMEKGLETAFNGTILLGPVKSVLRCVIGIKIESVQKGLTWVHDHAHVDFPLFANSTFSLGAKDSISGDSGLHTFLASPSSVTTNEVTGAVDRVTDWLRNNLVKEALLSTGILLVYVIVVLVGLTRTLIRLAVPDSSRARGGNR